MSNKLINYIPSTNSQVFEYDEVTQLFKITSYGDEVNSITVPIETKGEGIASGIFKIGHQTNKENAIQIGILQKDVSSSISDKKPGKLWIAEYNPTNEQITNVSEFNRYELFYNGIMLYSGWLYDNSNYDGNIGVVIDKWENPTKENIVVSVLSFIDYNKVVPVQVDNCLTNNEYGKITINVGNSLTKKDNSNRIFLLSQNNVTIEPYVNFIWEVGTIPYTKDTNYNDAPLNILLFNNSAPEKNTQKATIIVANDDYYHIVGSVTIGSEVYLNERYADILLDSSKNPRLIIKSNDNSNIFLNTLYITARDLTANTSKLEVKISPDADNAIVSKTNGLYVSSTDFTTAQENRFEHAERRLDLIERNNISVDVSLQNLAAQIAALDQRIHPTVAELDTLNSNIANLQTTITNWDFPTTITRIHTRLSNLENNLRPLQTIVSSLQGNMDIVKKKLGLDN